MKTNLKPISNSSKKAFFFVNRPTMNMLNFVYEINLVDLQSLKKKRQIKGTLQNSIYWISYCPNKLT